MNSVIMLQLAEVLESIPSFRFNMDAWIYRVMESDLSSEEDKIWDIEYLVDNSDLMELDINKCGTAGCIAGWASSLINNLSYTTTNSQEVVKEANFALGLKPHEGEQLYHIGPYSVWERYKEELGLVDEDRSVRIHSIENTHAAAVLKMIVNGEMRFLSLEEMSDR